MVIDYRISKVVVRTFRGIDSLDLEIMDDVPSVLIGSNNAGKSTVLHAIALALNGGGYHQWSPSEPDFFCDSTGQRANEFTVQVNFHSAQELGYPAVKGIGKPTLIHGVQVKGRRTKDGRMSHSRTLLDEAGNAVTFSTRTPLGPADKEKFADHEVGYRPFNARLDDIRAHTPELWFFQPKNIEASLYVWKTGPIAKLSKLLAKRFLEEKWIYKPADGAEREMPATIVKAHDFLRRAVEAFPFWKGDMKPRLESIFERYVGTHAKIDLKPDVQALEDWLAQQLEVSLAMDQGSAATPLRNMGDGWQSVIRLAALEAVCEYPELAKERVVLLLEEPETHLHPHLRRKMRKVLSALSGKGWMVIYTTHSPELISFDERQVITRMIRVDGRVQKRSIDTETLEGAAKLQSKLDERGAHDFLFSTRSVFCEGKDDSFALRLGLDKSGVDYDARSVSIAQCGSVTAIPAFVSIASSLGIQWCGLTDEDSEPDGSIKPQTAKVRSTIEASRQDGDMQAQWPGSLERSLHVSSGKASPEVVLKKLSESTWKTSYPNFTATVSKIEDWINSAG